MAYFEIKDLTISFGGLKALDRVSLGIDQGTIFALIGPNGAGKTTIFNCVNGIYHPEGGQILFKDREITHLRPDQIARRGIARTFQNIELFSHMTTMENLMLGRHNHLRTGVWTGATFFRRRSFAAREEMANRKRVERIIDLLDLQSARDQLVSNLPFGTQKLVELGRALALEPELLLLDEPSGGMNLEEKGDLVFWIKDIQEDLGITILLVEHDMAMVMDISDQILVVNHGEVIAEGSPGEIQKHPEVIKAYLGEEEVVDGASQGQ